MNLSRPFIERPIGTTLLTVAIALTGVAAFFLLPVAPLPQVESPGITVRAQVPGGSPATLASSVAAPLERRLGSIPGVTEMSSSSGNGSTLVNLHYEPSKKLATPAPEVQAAINAARADLPISPRSNPTYSKSNSTDSPVIVLALTSKTRSTGQIYEAVSNQIQQRLMQVDGVGDVELGGGSLPAVRIELLPFATHRQGLSAEEVRAATQPPNANRPKGNVDGTCRPVHIHTTNGPTAQCTTPRHVS